MQNRDICRARTMEFARKFKRNIICVQVTAHIYTTHYIHVKIPGKAEMIVLLQVVFFLVCVCELMHANTARAKYKLEMSFLFLENSKKNIFFFFFFSVRAYPCNVDPGPANKGTN